jgi:hypothetical protein
MQEFLALNKFKTALIIDMAYVMADAMLGTVLEVRNEDEISTL